MTLLSTPSGIIFPILPQGMERDGFVRLVESAARELGLGAAALRTFRAMIEVTRPRTFKSYDTEPICYQQQVEVAKRLGISPGRVRAHEQQLTEAGLIEKRTMANGARSGFHGCGITFSPGIRLVRWLSEIVAHKEEERRLTARLRGRRSQILREVSGMLRGLVEAGTICSDLQILTDAFQRWPTHRKLHSLSVVQLHEHLVEAEDLADRLRVIWQKTPKSSGQDTEIERSHTEEITQEIIEKPPEKSDPVQPRERAEQFLQQLTPKRLRDICSEPVQLHLEVIMRDGTRPDARMLQQIAWARVEAMGVNGSAILDAQAAFGLELTSLAILMFDGICEGRPDIRRPAAYFAALCGRCRKNPDGAKRLICALLALKNKTTATKALFEHLRSRSAGSYDH